MNPEIAYQTSIARIDESQRQAALSRLAAQMAGGQRPASHRLRLRAASRLRWRAGRSRRPSMSERFA
jgi:hypothetical protein